MRLPGRFHLPSSTSGLVLLLVSLEFLVPCHGNSVARPVDSVRGPFLAEASAETELDGVIKDAVRNRLEGLRRLATWPPFVSRTLNA